MPQQQHVRLPPTDPFEGYTMQHLLELPETQFRSWQVHTRMVDSYRMEQICRKLDRLKESISLAKSNARANLALIVSGITAITAIAAVIVAIKGG